jgi:hypothetical protein
MAAVAAGRVDDTELLFMEQDLSVSVTDATEGTATIEWCMPSADDAKVSARLRLTTSRADLARAAAEWQLSLRALVGDR